MAVLHHWEHPAKREIPWWCPAAEEIHGGLSTEKDEGQWGWSSTVLCWEQPPCHHRPGGMGFGTSRILQTKGFGQSVQCGKCILLLSMFWYAPTDRIIQRYRVIYNAKWTVSCSQKSNDSNEFPALEVSRWMGAFPNEKVLVWRRFPA